MFEETDLREGVQNEESLFQTAIVPLKLVVNGETMWSNNQPSSSHFCRPLNLQYKEETAEVSKDEAERVKHQINTLHPFCTEGVEINFRVDVTMLDGKVVNAITDTKSTQSCNVCGVTSKDVNDLDKVRSSPVDEALKLGLPLLHCWLRSFEYCLHMGYKMDIKSYYAKGEK